MNFIKRFYKSLYDFDKYDEFIKQDFFKAFLNVLMISVISVVLLCTPYLLDYVQLGGITGAINKYVPEFTIENGILTTDKVLKNEVEKYSLMLIDTQNPHTEQDLMSYESGLIITKDKIIMKLFSGDTKIQDYKLYEQGGLVNKQAVLKFVPIVKFYLIIFCIMLMGFMVLQNLFYAVIFAMFSNVINLYIRAKMSTFDTFKLACYAMSMPILIKSIISFLDLMLNTITQFYMPEFILFGLVATYCYFALKSIKDKNDREENRKKALL